ncbi:formimidoylglutamase [soil metagenome]
MIRISNPSIPLMVYDGLHISSLVKLRDREIKLGEKVQTLPFGTQDNLLEALSDNSCRYVLLGLPEDIGVRANAGRGGAYSAWQPALNTLLNVQSNRFLSGEEILVLGHLDFSGLMLDARNLNVNNPDDLILFRNLVQVIDEAVSPIINAIIQSGKEAIIIGGGHNNSYPNLRGAAQGLKASGASATAQINCINCDAHSDLRPTEGRHSGNGFSYAFNENWLHKYAMVGLHEIFNNASVIDKILNEPRVQASFFEDIFIREKLTFAEAVNQAIQFVGVDNYLGLELDLDTVQNIPASAKTSSGISTIDARKLVHEVASKCKVAYFHLAEAAPVLSHIKTDLKTGKLIAYLITDYIKARNDWYSR